MRVQSNVDDVRRALGELRRSLDAANAELDRRRPAEYPDEVIHQALVDGTADPAMLDALVLIVGDALRRQIVCWVVWYGGLRRGDHELWCMAIDGLELAIEVSCYSLDEEPPADRIAEIAERARYRPERWATIRNKSAAYRAFQDWALDYLVLKVVETPDCVSIRASLEPSNIRAASGRGFALTERERYLLEPLDHATRRHHFAW